MKVTAGDQLFDDGLKLNWLPDELLFSLASRYHILSHNVLASRTCSQLFGSPRQGCAHDFPSRIDCFVERTQGSFGDSEEVIRRHTILSFYLPFQSAAIAASAISAVRGPSIGSLKFQLGLLTSRFRAHHPLKACLECIRDDRANFSVAYWHRTHQLPGVWICHTHNMPLHESTLKSTGVGRFSWSLPSEKHLRQAWPADTAHHSGALLTFRLLAEAAESISETSPDVHFDQGRMVIVYREGLRNLGMLHGNPGRLALRDIADGYRNFVQPIRGIDEFSGLPKSSSEALAQMPRLVRMGQKQTHPIRHLTLICWIFGGWRHFWETYKNQDQACLAIDRRPQPMKLHFVDEALSKRNALIKLLADGAWSVSRAARHLGIDPTTAMAWAAANNIATPKRPKFLKPPLLEKLIALLVIGTDIDSAAKTVGISSVTVIKVLRTQMGLHHSWRQARQDRARQKNRGFWTEVVTANPLLGPKAVRTIEPAAYAWLYRNDRPWLNTQIANLPQSPPSNHANTSWDARDAAIAHSIRQAALELAFEQPGKWIALWKIYQRLPELKAKLGKLDRLPLSKQALDAATRRPDQTIRTTRIPDIPE